MSKYNLVITEHGLNLLQDSMSTNKIFPAKYIGVGDSNGSYYEPEKTQTDLKNLKYMGTIFKEGKAQDNNGNKYLYYNIQIPASVGGFTIREAGLYDNDKKLLAVAKYKESNKAVADGDSEDFLIIELQIFLSDEAINMIVIDNSGILATEEMIDANYQKLCEKGAANGYASLDINGKVPETQLPETINNLPVFCFNSGKVDENGGSALCSLESNVLTLYAPAVCTTADGKTYKVEENKTLELSDSIFETAQKINIFYNAISGELEAYPNTVYIGTTEPEDFSIQDIWVNTSVKPYKCLKKISDEENAECSLVWNAVVESFSGNTTLYNKPYNHFREYSVNKFITNCYTELPESIFYELTDTGFTLKKDTVAIFPYGTEAPTKNIGDDLFDNEEWEITDIQYENNKLFYWAKKLKDKTINYFGAASTGDYLATANKNGSIFTRIKNYSSETQPTDSCVWYDTTNNKVRRIDSGTPFDDEYYSLPILKVTFKNSSIPIGVKNVFNNFGYIGGLFFANKGIKGLVPDGRNEDGTLKNLEIETKKLYMTQVTNITTEIAASVGLVVSQSTKEITSVNRIALQCLWESENIPTSEFPENQVVYVKSINKIYWYNSSNKTWSPVYYLYVPASNMTYVNGLISDMSTINAFRAANIDDILSLTAPIPLFHNLTLGATGAVIVAPIDGLATLYMNSNKVGQFVGLGIQSGQSLITSRAPQAVSPLGVWIRVAKGTRFFPSYDCPIANLGRFGIIPLRGGEK